MLFYCTRNREHERRPLQSSLPNPVHFASLLHNLCDCVSVCEYVTSRGEKPSTLAVRSGTWHNPRLFLESFVPRTGVHHEMILSVWNMAMTHDTNGHMERDSRSKHLVKHIRPSVQNVWTTYYCTRVPDFKMCQGSRCGYLLFFWLWNLDLLPPSGRVVSCHNAFADMRLVLPPPPTLFTCVRFHVEQQQTTLSLYIYIYISNHHFRIHHPRRMDKYCKASPSWEQKG